VFSGKEASRNNAIFYVLTQQSPLAVWNMLGHVKHLPGFKRTKYAVISTRVKALEAQGYLRRTGTRAKKQGGETKLYELTARAQLAMALSNKTMDDVIKELDEDSALIILRIISKNQDRSIASKRLPKPKL
jgi:hypothetical protein